MEGSAANTAGVFLLTPLREGRRARQLHRAAVRKHFYSRPCGRGDDGDLPPIKNLRDFYSRPCGRGDLARPDNTRRDLRFLLTPLREGRPITSASWSGRKLFLLTPLREGRLRHAEKGRRNNPISTHAPAGGATADARSQGGRGLISTHAPAGGATRRLTRSGR